MNSMDNISYLQGNRNYSMMSWEFPHGTFHCKNPVSDSVKLIHDKQSGKIYVFSKAGKDGIPMFELSEYILKYRSSRLPSCKWNYTKAAYMASRICVKDKEGNCSCLKSRFSAPSNENAEDILDVSKAIMNWSIETGLEPTIVADDEVMYAA